MLRATHLTRRFNGRVAVEDVSFEVGTGEIFALLGPNGAGKTTTLRMLAGLIKPTSGAVDTRGRIGFLTEAAGLWERLSVRQNLTIYARLHGLPDSRRAVDEALQAFDLVARGDEPAVTLSKGLKQRVALARTLLHHPDIVLLDEPTSGLDPASAREVRELILHLRERGRAILLSTHNLDEVERVADRVAVLRTRLLASDTPAALRSRLFGARLRVVLASSAEPYVTVLHRSGITDVRLEEFAMSIGVDEPRTRAPDIVRELVHAGAPILAVMPEKPPLEEVYLRLLSESGS
jgi:ABC-2 type transport system ATP-binding protein